MVNCQNPLGFRIFILDPNAFEEVFVDEKCLKDYKRVLNLKEAALYSNFILETSHGKQLQIKSCRFVSKNNKHRWGIKYQIEALNFSSQIIIDSYIDGSVLNGKNIPYLPFPRHLINQ